MPKEILRISFGNLSLTLTSKRKITLMVSWNKNIILILIVICLSSCQRLMLAALGMHRPKEKTHTQIMTSFSEKSDKSVCIQQLDSDYYFFLVNTYDTTNSYGKTRFKWYLQPLQALYFDNSSGKMVAAIANCDGYRKSLRQLTWNPKNELDTFPAPYTYGIDSNFLLTSFRKAIVPVNSNCKSVSQAPYTVILIWSDWIGASAKTFVQEIEENVRKSGKEVEMIYVNADNFYAKYAEF